MAYLTLQATSEGQAAHAHVHEVIRGLEARGWDVALFEPDYDRGIPGPVGRIMEFRRTQERLLSSGSYDLVYVRAHPFAGRVSRQSKRKGTPVVQEVNGVFETVYQAWPASRRLAPILESWTRQQYRWADALIAVTPRLAEWACEVSGGTRTVVIPNGADADLFEPGDGARMPPYVVFFGALSEWQGVDSLIEAATSEWWPQGVDVVIAGDGALRSLVDEAAATHSHISRIPQVPYREVPALVSGALASYVVKRLRDDQADIQSPLKAYESLACGVPIIVSPIQPIADEVTEHECGIVVPMSDARAIANAVAELAREPDRAAAMGSRGRDFVVRTHTWGCVCDMTDELLRDVLERRRA